MLKDLEFIETNSCFFLKRADDVQVARLFFSVSNNIVCINRLFVNPEYRKKGIANFLLHNLIKTYPKNIMLVTANPDDLEYMSTNSLLKLYGKFKFVFLRETDEGTLMQRN